LRGQNSVFENASSFVTDKISFAEKTFCLARMKYFLLKRDFTERIGPSKSPDKIVFPETPLIWRG
jgi:hypothetical protein